ncbi:hypothetical protein QYM36_013350, partial [Artemia franciscana]
NFIQTVILHYKRLASALAREQLDRATEVSLLVEKFRDLKAKLSKNFIQTVILHYKRLASALAREQLDRATEVSLLVEKFRDLKAKLSK